MGVGWGEGGLHLDILMQGARAVQTHTDRMCQSMHHGLVMYTARLTLCTLLNSHKNTVVSSRRVWRGEPAQAEPGHHMLFGRTGPGRGCYIARGDVAERSVGCCWRRTGREGAERGGRREEEEDLLSCCCCVWLVVVIVLTTVYGLYGT